MKDIHDLSKKLYELDLSLTYYGNGVYAVGSPEFANPLMHFNEGNKGDNYDGNVKVKSINVRLFTSKQIHESLKLVDDYLLYGNK